MSKRTFSAAVSCIAALLATLAAPSSLAGAGPRAAAPDAHAAPGSGPSVARGRYLAKTSGCNDCHTAGYMPQAGRIPESEWLKGDSLGWSGPWGTTYAANLRLFMGRLTEDQWVAYARGAELRPPMPWFGMREMSDADLRSIYRFVRSLGAAGEPAPAYLPPGVKPTGPYVQFMAPPGPTKVASAK
jgi:mono/diheme cytochrome c family protein